MREDGHDARHRADPRSSPRLSAVPDPSAALRPGDRGANVAALRSKLAVLGLLDAADLLPTDPDQASFDRDCELAVRSLQQQRGLTADGVVGPLTHRALDEARWRLGDRVLVHSVGHPPIGDDVAALQQRLLELGFDSGRVDGVFGPQTEVALRDFQRNVGLVPDGVCGPGTFTALERLRRTVVGGRPHALREDELIHAAGPGLANKLVVIDPGHGGPDRGVVAANLEEAAIVEDVAMRIEGRFAATGVMSFRTRGGADLSFDDAERAAFANSAEADLLISLHCDGASSPAPNGVACFYYGNDRFGHFSPVGERLARLMLREVCARTDLLDLGVHGRTDEVLRRTRMPAVRLELGYLTHPGDAVRLADPAFRDAVADAVVAAVARLYQHGVEGVVAATTWLHAALQSTTP